MQVGRELDAFDVQEAAQGGEGDLAAAGDCCDVGDSLEGGRAGQVAQGVLDVGVELVVGPARVSGVGVAQVATDEGAHIGDVHGALLSGAGVTLPPKHAVSWTAESDALAIFVVFMVVLWGGTMGFTLLLTRFRLTSGDATVMDHLVVRGTALVTVTLAMWSLASLMGRILAVTDPAALVPYLWVIAAVPLLAPQFKSNGNTLVSSEQLIYLSIVLTAAGSFVLAAVMVVRVFAGGVELQ